MFDEIKELQLQEQEYNDILKKAEKITRLCHNQDFIDIILNGYCVEKCSEYMEVATSDNADEYVKKNSLEAAKSCGYLKNYLDSILTRSMTAQDNINQIKERIESLQSNSNEE